MILIFEEDTKYQPFGENVPECGPSAFMLASKEFEMGEISNTFHSVTGISISAVKAL